MLKARHFVNICKNVALVKANAQLKEFANTSQNF
jgi:hypothetical protein